MGKRGAILTAQSYVEVFADLDRLRTNLKAGERMVRNFAATVGTIGSQLLKTSAVLAAPQAMAVRTFGQFEKSMSRVKALTNATEGQFQALSERAQELGRTTVFTAGEAADAMSEFALAGYKVEDILAATGPTLDLAAAGQIGIAEAAGISSKIMAGMGYTANELGGVVDLLAKAMSTANTDVRQLGEAFKFVGPMAKTAGISLEEITAAIQLLSNAGIQGEMAGTTLRGMLSTLTSPSEKGREVLKSLGIQVTDSAGRVRSLVDIIGQFETAMAGMQNGQRLDLLGQIFPDRQMVGGIELIAQGSTKLRDFTKALQSAGGTAGRIATTQLDNLWGQLKIIESAIEAVSIRFTAALVPSLRMAQESLIGWLGGLERWVQANPQAVQQLAQLTLAIGATGAALIAAKVALIAFAGVLGTLAAVIKSPLVLITGLIYAIGGFDGVIAALKVQIGELGPVWGTAWTSITESIKSGNLEQAFEVAFLTIKVTVLRVIQAIKDEFAVLIGFIETTIAGLKDAYDFASGIASAISPVEFTGGPVQKIGKKGSAAPDNSPPDSEAVINAEKALADAIKRADDQNWLDRIQTPAPAAPPTPSAQPGGGTVAAQGIISPDMAAQIRTNFNASANLSPLGNYERGTEQAQQLVLDALGYGQDEVLGSINEEIKSVAAATEAHLELAKRDFNQNRRTVTLRAARRSNDG